MVSAKRRSEVDARAGARQGAEGRRSRSRSDGTPGGTDGEAGAPGGGGWSGSINEGHGALNFSKHAFQRMAERAMDEKDCRNILCAGRWRGPDFKSGTWR